MHVHYVQHHCQQCYFKLCSSFKERLVLEREDTNIQMPQLTALREFSGNRGVRAYWDHMSGWARVQKEKRCSGWIQGSSIHGINTQYRRRMWDQRCRRSSWQNPTAILRKKKKNPPWIWIRKKLFNPLRAPTRVLSHIVVMTDCLPFPQDLEQTMYVTSHHTNCLCIGNSTLCNQAGKRSERQGERKHLLLSLDLSASRERPCLKNMRWSMIDKDTRCRPQCKDTHTHIWQDLQSKSKSKTYRN